MRVMQFAEKPASIVIRQTGGKPVCCGGRRAAAWQATEPMHTLPTRTAAVVLDTNVVLDLWLFDDARAAPLRGALEGGRLRALVTSATLAELADVLQRPVAIGRPATAAQVMAALCACSTEVAPPATHTPAAPRCTDTDDQKFIDLAWTWPATWLLSRDKAVLKLARAGRARGLHIVTPEVWARLDRGA